MLNPTAPPDPTPYEVYYVYRVFRYEISMEEAAEMIRYFKRQGWTLNQILEDLTQERDRG